MVTLDPPNVGEGPVSRTGAAGPHAGPAPQGRHGIARADVRAAASGADRLHSPIRRRPARQATCQSIPRGCCGRGAFEAWLLLAASCTALGAAVINWNPQGDAVLVLPVLTLPALFVVDGPGAWSRLERLLLAMVAAKFLPDAISNDTFYAEPLHAGIPLTLSAMVLVGSVPGRLIRVRWAALTCLAVLWLLPRATATAPMRQLMTASATSSRIS
jgi:hypothetical protein